MTDLQKWVDKNIEGGLVPMIFDRHRLISEPIYGSIIRPEASEGFNELSWLAPRLHRLYHMKPVIIYCLPSEETVIRNLTGDPDNTAVVDKAKQIYRAYVAKVAQDYTMAPCRPLVWNYESSSRVGEKKLPIWFPGVKAYINDLLSQKVETTW